MKSHDTFCDDPPSTSGDFARFVLLLWNTALVADRCYEEIDGARVTARETFEHLVERLATIRVDFEALSPVEKTAMRHNLEALEDHERDLRRLLDASPVQQRPSWAASS